MIQGSGKRLRQRASRLFSPSSDDSWDGVQKNQCVPGTVAAVTLTQQPCGVENMKVGWSRAYYPRLALSLAIYAGSDCNTWPQGMGVHGAEVMGAAGEVPVSPPLCFGVVENRLAFGARGCSHPVLSGIPATISSGQLLDEEPGKAEVFKINASISSYFLEYILLFCGSFHTCTLLS